MDNDGGKTDSNVYICGNCVQILLNLSQEQLTEAHALAIEKGYANKADAIKSFLEVQSNESRNRHYTSKRLNGKRSLRIAGNEKIAGRGFEKPERPSLYQDQSKKQAVL